MKQLLSSSYSSTRNSSNFIEKLLSTKTIKNEILKQETEIID
jgi:hypothetical protein